MAVFCDHGSVRENWKLISEDNVEEGSSIIIFDNTVWQSVSSMPSSKRIQRTPAVRYCSSAKMANHHDVIIAPFELGVDDLASWVNLFDAAALSQRLHSLSLDDALLKYCNIEMLFFLLCCISRYLPCFMSRPKMRSSAGSPLHMHCQLCWGSQLQVLPPVCGDFDKIDNLTYIFGTLFIGVYIPGDDNGYNPGDDNGYSCTAA